MVNPLTVGTEVEQMRIKNIKKRFRGKSPEIQIQSDGTAIIKLKTRRTKNWIHR